MKFRTWFSLLGFISLLVAEMHSGEAPPVNPAVSNLVTQLVSDDSEMRAKAITGLARTGARQAGRILELFRLGSYYSKAGHPVVYEETVEDEDFNVFGLLLNPYTGEPLLSLDGRQQKIDIFELEELDISRDERKQVRRAEVLLRLSAKDTQTRLGAVKKSGQPPRSLEALPFLIEMALNDPHDKVRFTARESVLLIQLTESLPGTDETTRIKAAKALGKMKSLRAAPVFAELLKVKEQMPAELAAACEASAVRIADHQSFVNHMGSIVQGVSLGSVLILMALGLAITFGLMGVINMAHGELMMIGAYTTFEMQRLFGHTADAPNDWYYFAALPASFLAAAIVGAIIEILVVRHLYRRPLESLLATWGVGLILIQIVRVRYGDNIGINAPTWARGGVEAMQDVMIPYARIFILVLCAGCVWMIYSLMNKTSLGLRMRAVMQNRDMADSLGVNTKRVDLYTFALGSGVAGIAGYAWTTIGGVTPDMGQQIFIVDSFLVVVTGGVGELAGVICSGMGIGLLTKFVEPIEIGNWTFGPVWAKVVLLAVIVGFIQFKPAGLFGPKGRLSDV